MVDIDLSVVAGSQLQVLIPVWFYVFSGIAYFTAAAVSLAVSYFAFRLYRTSGQRKIKFLSLAFLILGLAFLSLTVSSVYTYFYQPVLRDTVGITLTSFNSSAFGFYYIASALSYLILLLTYLPDSLRKRLFVFYVPLYFSGVDEFHVASILLLAFVVYQAAANFFKSRSTNAFLVLLAFSLMAVFHVTMLMLPFDLTYFLVSHALLVVGFLSLLAMLIRVNRNEKRNERSGKRRR